MQEYHRSETYLVASQPSRISWKIYDLPEPLLFFNKMLVSFMRLAPWPADALSGRHDYVHSEKCSLAFAVSSDYGALVSHSILLRNDCLSCRQPEPAARNSVEPLDCRCTMTTSLDWPHPCCLLDFLIPFSCSKKREEHTCFSTLLGELLKWQMSVAMVGRSHCFRQQARPGALNEQLPG